MNSTTEARRVHEGRNLKRIREILQVKQSALASELGGDWNQKKISQLEDRDTIEPDLLDEIAQALKVPVEAIRNFDEEAAITYFNTFQDGSINNGHFSPRFNNCTFNSFEKLMEEIAENKKLYERLLQAEKEKVEMLERLLKEKE